jgi:hypothetical protein
LSSKTYYDILGVARDASQDAIRSAFRSAAKRYHPDLFLSYIQKIQATAKMQGINTAYTILKDPESRRRYDATLPKQGMDRPYSVPGNSSRNRRPTSQDGVTGAAANPHTRRHSRMEPGMPWMIFIWLVASFAFGYLQWSGTKSKTLGYFLLNAAVSLMVSPLLLMVLFSILMLPAAYIMRGFHERSELHQRGLSSRKGKVFLDMLLRLAGLAAVVGVGALAWHYGFTPDLLFFALIAVGGGLIGEIAAMIVYLSRRSVVHSTEMLLRLTPEPLEQ